MPTLLTDQIGRPKPQYETSDGSAFEALKGQNGHMNSRSDDGQIVTIGAKADTAVTVSTGSASVIALLKGIVDWLSKGRVVGTHANAWNNVAAAANATSTSVDTNIVRVLSLFGNVSAATILTVQYSQNNSTWYDGTKLDLVAGNFAIGIPVGARYVRLKTSAAATITATIAGKG